MPNTVGGGWVGGGSGGLVKLLPKDTREYNVRNNTASSPYEESIFPSAIQPTERRLLGLVDFLLITLLVMQ